MEKMILALIVTIMQSGFYLKAQQETKTSLDRKNLIAVDAAFTPSRLINESKTMYYAHGSLSFYPTSRLSFRGDSSFSFREFQDNEVSMRYHSTFFGLCYHFTENGAFDPFIGIQPGMSVFERSFFNDMPITKNREVIPNGSVVLGLTFFMNRYFNFFGNVRYVYGQPAKNPTAGSGLHEIRLAFGLGLNLAQQK